MTKTIAIPTLETARLILRAPALDDFPAWAATFADEETNRYIGGTMDEDAAWRHLAGAVGTWGLRGFGVWSVVEKATSAWVGRVGCVKPHNWPGTEVGYVIAREHWGKGYASEAARAAIDYAFETLGWTEVIHSIHPENVASQAVARRLGARRDGEVDLPLGLGPTDKWVHTRWDWTQKRIARGVETTPPPARAPGSRRPYRGTSSTSRPCLAPPRRSVRAPRRGCPG